MIVYGRLEEIKIAEPVDERVRRWDIGYVKVTKVYKNLLEGVSIEIGDRITLETPSVNSGMATSIDNRKEGLTGIWVIKYIDGHFRASHLSDQYTSLIEKNLIRLLEIQTKDSTKNDN